MAADLHVRATPSRLIVGNGSPTSSSAGIWPAPAGSGRPCRPPDSNSDNLDIDSNELVSTPGGAFSLEPVGTADAARGTHAVLTKAKPCGLSHPFKIN